MDPNSFRRKHPAVMLKRIRSIIEPSLSAAGFVFQGRNNPYPGPPLFLYLDYTRGEEEIRVAFDRREDERFIGFTAEFLSATGDKITIATCRLSGIPAIPKESQNAAVRSLLDTFTKEVNDFLAVPPSMPGAELPAADSR